jgi:glycerol-3-phosphate acyltransferase PlsY
VTEAALIAGAYLLGSMPFGYWVVRALKGADIRTVGSGNIGASNVWRTYGKAYGVPIVVLDTAKGFVPGLVGTLVAGELVGVLAGGAAMLGHWRPLFLRFQKGGKMVATAGGTFFGAAPLLGLAGLAGVYPALAGRAHALWARAALGAVGMCWLLLAEPVLDRELVFGGPAESATAALEQIATSGALLLVPVWALAALMLPWLAPHGRLPVAIAGATVWATATAVATAAVAEQANLPEPRHLAVGAVAAGVIAVLGARPRDTVETGHNPVRTGT